MAGGCPVSPASPLAKCSSCACGWSPVPCLAPRKPRSLKPVCPVVAATVSCSVGAVTWVGVSPNRAYHQQTRPPTLGMVTLDTGAGMSCLVVRMNFTRSYMSSVPFPLKDVKVREFHGKC